MTIFDPESFQSRHIGPSREDAADMLKVVGAPSMEVLIDEAIPARIRSGGPLKLSPGKSEHQYLSDLRTIAAANRVFKSYIGLGYSSCITPSVILRNVLENPGW